MGNACHGLSRGSREEKREDLVKIRVMPEPRGEALFRCARPSGVPRGPATSTGSLASQSKNNIL